MKQSILLLIQILQIIPFILSSVELGNSSLLIFSPNIVGQQSTTTIRSLTIPHTIPNGGYIDLTYPLQWQMVEASGRTYVDCTIFQGNTIYRINGQINFALKKVTIIFSLNIISTIDIMCSSLENPGSNYTNTVQLQIYDNLHQLLSYKSYSIDIIAQTLSGIQIDLIKKAVSFIPSSLYTNDKQNLNITFTPMNKMQIGSQIIINFPLINPQAQLIDQISMLDSSSVCLGIKGIDSDLSCQYQNNQLIITNGYKTIGNLNHNQIEIQITNFQNPQSTQPITGIQLITKDINQGFIDQYLTGTVTVNYPSNIQSVQLISSNYQIRQSTNITFIITPSTFLNAQSVLQVTFPRLFDLTNTTKVQSEIQIIGQQNVNQGILQYNYSDYCFTIPNLNNAYSSDVAYIIQFLNIKNYDQVQQSNSSFQVKLLDQQMYSIQQMTSNLMYQTTPGGLNNVTITFNETTIQQNSEVVLSFNVGDYLNANAQILIVFPNDFIVQDLPSQICPPRTILSGIDRTAFCQISNNSFILNQGFPSGIQIGQFVSIRVVGLTNPILSQKVTNPINIQLKQIDLLIDQDFTHTFTFQSGNITITKFDSILTKQTYQLSDYQIQFSNQNQLPINSSFLIIFPDDISLSLSQTIGINCIYLQGFQQNTICEMNNNQLEVSFVNSQTPIDKNTSFIIILENIFNPRSLKQLGPLQIISLNGIYIIDESHSSPLLVMSTPNQFKSIQFDTSNQILGQQTNYKFLITSGEVIQAGDQLEIQFPGCISISNAQYEGQTTRFRILQNNVVSINIDQNVDANQTQTINILNLTNPILQQQAAPFIFTLKSQDSYIVTKNTDALGVVAFKSKLMKNFMVSINNSKVAEESNYIFQFQTSYPVPVNGYIFISIPQSLSIEGQLCSFLQNDHINIACIQINSTSMQIQVIGNYLLPDQYLLSLDQIRNKMNSDSVQDYFNIQTFNEQMVRIEYSRYFYQFKFSCDAGCNDCANNASYCITCLSDFILLQNKCVMNCGKGYVLNGNKCQKCSSNCSICDSTKRCLVCDTGFLLNDSYQCFIKTYNIQNNTNITNQTQIQLGQTINIIEPSSLYSADFENMCYISFYVGFTLIICIFSKIVYKQSKFFYSLQSWICLIELPVSLMLAIFAYQNEQYIYCGIVILFILLNHLLFQILAVKAIMNQLQIDQMHKSVSQKSFQAYFIQVIMIIWNFKYFLMFQSGWSNEKEAHQKKIYSFQMEPFIKYYGIQFIRILSDLTISVLLVLIVARWVVWPFDFVIFYSFNVLVNLITYFILKKDQKNREIEELQEKVSNDKANKDLEIQLDNREPASNDPMTILNQNMEFLKLPFHRNRQIEDNKDNMQDTQIKQNEFQNKETDQTHPMYQPIQQKSKRVGLDDHSINSNNSLCISDIHSQIGLNEKQNKNIKQIELNQIEEVNQECSAEKGNSAYNKIQQQDNIIQNIINPPNFDYNEEDQNQQNEENK